MATTKRIAKGKTPAASITESSGNVFADMGLPNPEQELMKARLTLQIHRLIRVTLTERPGGGAEGVRILYGGSVGPKNAAAIFAAEAVDGALVGRASLKAADFAAIVLAHPATATRG